MTLNSVKLERTVTFVKHLASVVSLIFLVLNLIWNKITFPASNMLNLAQLVVNKPMNNIYKKITNLFDLSPLNVKTSRAHN